MSGIPRDGLPPSGAFQQIGPDEWVEAEPLSSVRVFTAEMARQKARIWIIAMLIFGAVTLVGTTTGPEWLGWAALPFSVCLVRSSYWTGRTKGIRDGV